MSIKFDRKGILLKHAQANELSPFSARRVSGKIVRRAAFLIEGFRINSVTNEDQLLSRFILCLVSLMNAGMHRKGKQ